jgi:serine/threonine protein kinase
VPEESSLELTNSKSTTNSSKGSRLSSASATSLTNIREMLSDGPIIFQYKDLCKATENFTPSRKVGGTVYRGKLQKTEMAIVVDKRGGGNQNFVAEIKHLGSVHHSNLVRLLGGCMNGDHVYLVYDFITGGNLRQYLHSPHSPGFSALPTWMSRIQVALEVSKGLEYVHHHTLMPTIHKYMKSSNILLDDDLHVRIAYFGVAKIRGELKSEQGEIREVKGGKKVLRRSHSIKITGTHGYMAPEYVAGGLISTKLDVFAFGVVLLELLSGKEPVSFQANVGATQMKKTLLTEVIMSICGERDPKSRLRAWVDPLLRDRFPLDCALKTAQLARSCVDPCPELRPDMSKVSMTLLQIQMSSQIWDDKMKASKDLLTSTMQAR